MFISAFSAVHAVLMTLQHAEETIPDGVIQKIEYTKAGKRIDLDSGGHAVFPGDVLFNEPTPIDLKIGDRVSKNGTASSIISTASAFAGHAG